jgi:chromatin remodeling complex protein RSC6
MAQRIALDWARGNPEQSARARVITPHFSMGDDMAKKAAKSKRKPNAAFMRPVQPSAALSEVVGAKPLPRTEVTKKLWAYIKKNKLQDQKNRRMIKSDDTLKPIFGGKSQVNMFEMTRLVGKHLK